MDQDSLAHLVREIEQEYFLDHKFIYWFTMSEKTWNRIMHYSVFKMYLLHRTYEIKAKSKPFQNGTIFELGISVEYLIPDGISGVPMGVIWHSPSLCFNFKAQEFCVMNINCVNFVYKDDSLPLGKAVIRRKERKPR